MTAHSRRAPNAGHGEVIDRETTIPFSFNGRTYEGHPGDTIASALVASGVKVFSRSFKYHRPRGILTASWHDPNLMMQVDGEPNVRAGHRRVAAGMNVKSQDTWPSLRFDAKAMNGKLGRFLAPGFYYKTFIKPQALWPSYEAVLKRFVHAGSVDLTSQRPHSDKRYAHPDVLVAGGGPAGMWAAIAAADAGARVLLVEEEHELGGHWRWRGQGHIGKLAELRREVASKAAIETLPDSVVFGRYDDNWVGVVQRSSSGAETLLKVRPKAMVVAVGLLDRPYVFEGNDLPGVMLGSAASRLINLYGVRPGERAVVFTANGEGDTCVADLKRSGVDVVGTIDARQGDRVARATGRRGELTAVHTENGRVYAADLLVVSSGWTAPTSLLNMGGDVPQYDREAARFFPGSNSGAILATGGIAGDGTEEQQRRHASETGIQAARLAQETSQSWQAAVPTARIVTPSLSAPAEQVDFIEALPREPHPALFRASTHGFVDFSEDVSSKDLHIAVAEGYDSAELAKRYTTATMGPIQGKLETINSVAVIAEANGATIEETGTTVWRPPYAPVTLGALAGRELEPVRRSPLHDWHAEARATFMVAGEWLRPEHYGDAQVEAARVRQAVGIIDVTPLGKLDLRGTDVPRLLEALYVNKWTRLEVGHVRYGAMCSEDGVVFDDGVTGRLGPDSYLMTTTSSGADAVHEWIEMWLQTAHPDWDVYCTPVTGGYTSINCAGPSSRELLSRLTDIPLDSDEFQYMRVRRGVVAGVSDVVVWRIGFTGELSYELHIPAGFGQHVWDALLAAGATLGVGPFGVEAQRILRLEKGHLIVGQDTDGLTKALSAGLGWAVKTDKADFAGLPELRFQIEDGPATELVRLVTEDPSIVPAEASQLIDSHGAIIGRVTSSRMSPSLNRSVCLAQVTAAHAIDGCEMQIVDPTGKHQRAAVSLELCSFDREGERQRA